MALIPSAVSDSGRDSQPDVGRNVALSRDRIELRGVFSQKLQTFSNRRNF